MNYKPTQKQLKFLNWEFGAFFHFGIRSFNPGHNDWDGIEMDIQTFNPDSLDCGQWIKTIKSAGAKYAILTAKHHDGFANWPTKLSDYSVASTPWKKGKGDVVREFVDACRKYDIAVGLYYSPAQWGNSGTEFNGTDYDDYFVNQITELLSNYGKIDYLWFDGCGSENHAYNENRIISVIRKLQPDILLFEMWQPDTAWVGNEAGLAELNNNNVCTRNILGKDTEGFFPYECDCRIRDTWFYDNNEDELKSVDELVGMYEMSVGRGANLLLNIGPDHHGLLCSADVNRLMQFRAELDRLYSSPVEMNAVVQKSENEFVIEYSQEQQDKFGKRCNLPQISRVIIEEDITNGNAVAGFRLYASVPSINPIYEQNVCIYKGDTIGHKIICKFPCIKTARITLRITESNGNAKIKSIKAFN